MKIGIIVVFYNNEKKLLENSFIDDAKNIEHLQICLVNNCSKDNTYQILNEIKETYTSNIFTLDVKKHKSNVAAVRAGARSMFNQYDFKHIGFVSAEEILSNNWKISEFLKRVNSCQDLILKYNLQVLKQQKIKRTLFQNVFSLVEYLKQITLQEQQFVAEL